MQKQKFRQFEVRQGAYQKYTNITEDVQKVIDEWDIANGHVHVMVMHTTCTLLIQEAESWMINADLFRVLEELASAEGHYRHDDLSVRTENLDPNRQERKNGFAHVRAMLVGKPEYTIPVQDGKLFLGRWQRILLLDFDTRERIQSRTVTVSMIENPKFTGEG
ncbi:MAG: YjbQ family protein [Candidatus Niyogibacteria bacterium]|nr:YjbQ family protein [Candidatus Niyogibacteria bacterium]